MDDAKHDLKRLVYDRDSLILEMEVVEREGRESLAPLEERYDALSREIEVLRQSKK